jgi:hypothetical protein
VPRDRSREARAAAARAQQGLAGLSDDFAVTLARARAGLALAELGDDAARVVVRALLERAQSR